MISATVIRSSASPTLTISSPAPTSPSCEDAEVESRTSAGREECRHAPLVHPNANAIAGDTRLRHLEHRAANPIPIADADRRVREAFNGEILAELSVDEVVSLQLLLPVAIRLDLIDVHRALLTSVASEVALPISVEIQPGDATAPGHRILPDRGVHRATVPRDVARESDVYREQSIHDASR